MRKLDRCVRNFYWAYFVKLSIFRTFMNAGDAWVEVHHNMATMSDSIKAQLAGALVISAEPVSPTCAIADVFD